MVASKVILACALLVLVAETQAVQSSYYQVLHSPGIGHGYGHAPIIEHHAPSHYSYKYGVHDAHTGDVKSASESRSGDVVKGEYSLLQPDGITRTVHYTADKHNGFNAVVLNNGHPVLPQAHGQGGYGGVY